MGFDDLNQLMELDYEVRFTERDGKCTFIVTELGLVGSGADAAKAHASLVETKRKYFQALLDAGEAGSIKLPARHREKRDLIRSLTPFSIKILISAFVVIGIAVTLVPVLETQVNELGKAAKRAGQQFPKGFEEGVANLKPVTPEKQEKLLKSLRVYLDSLRPIIDEVSKTEADPKEGSGGNLDKPAGN